MIIIPIKYTLSKSSMFLQENSAHASLIRDAFSYFRFGVGGVLGATVCFASWHELASGAGALPRSRKILKIS